MLLISRIRRGMELAALLALGACSKDDLLTPDLPDFVLPESLTDLAGANALYAGALSDMVVAMTGTTGVVYYSGIFADEAFNGVGPWDRRDLSSDDGQLTETSSPVLLLHRARTALEIGGAGLGTYFGATDARIGEMWALAGMTYIAFGESWCSGMPFSDRTKSGPAAFGQPTSTAAMFQTAIERLNTAGGAAGGSARIINLIAVLRGRALLNMGQFSEAAQAVANVPTNYTYQFLHSPARQINGIFLQNQRQEFSVPNREGGNGLNFASAADARVPVSAPVPSFDGVTPQVYFLKYTGTSDPVSMVTGIEARLIQAEAALRANDVSGWLARLNEIRLTVSGLAPLSDPGSAAARVDLTFRERAFWMYLTAHRLGDLRRLVRQYARAAESVYPTGPYHKGGLAYGQQVALQVPQSEANNPNFHAGDCKVTTP